MASSCLIRLRPSFRPPLHLRPVSSQTPDPWYVEIDVDEPLLQQKLLNSKILKTREVSFALHHSALDSMLLFIFLLQLTSKFQHGDGLRNVLKLVSSSFATFNDTNWATTFSVLSKITPKETVIHSPLTDNVVQIFDDVVAEKGSLNWMGAREAANIVRSLAIIKKAPPNLVNRVSEEVSGAEISFEATSDKALSSMHNQPSNLPNGVHQILKPILTPPTLPSSRPASLFDFSHLLVALSRRTGPPEYPKSSPGSRTRGKRPPPSPTT